MRLLIRLYPLHDMDLIPYKLDKSFRFGSLVKNALTAYLKGEDYSLPPVSKIDWSNYDYTPLDCGVNFKDSPELEQLFVGMRNRYKSAFIKTVLRRYLNNVDMSGFYNNVVVKKDFSQKLEDSEVRRLLSSSEKKDIDKKREAFISKIREREEKEKISAMTEINSIKDEEILNTFSADISETESKITENNHYSENVSQLEVKKTVINEKSESFTSSIPSHKEIIETEDSYSNENEYVPVEIEDDDDLFASFIGIVNK